MDELRRFITVDTQQAVNVCDLDKNMESRPVVKPKFTADFPEAEVREGTDDASKKKKEERRKKKEERRKKKEEDVLRTFIDTKGVGDSTMKATTRARRLAMP